MSERCKAEVLIKDTWRVCRDGRRKFRMHYNRCRCRRNAVEGGFCKQHYEISKQRVVLISNQAD